MKNENYMPTPEQREQYAMTMFAQYYRERWQSAPIWEQANETEKNLFREKVEKRLAEMEAHEVK